MSKAVQDYWQSCAQQHALTNLSSSQLPTPCLEISNAELKDGKINDLAKVRQLLECDSNLVIIPLSAMRQHERFIPYVLQAGLANNGEFIVTPLTAWPIVLATVLEPAEPCPISLGSAESFDNYFVLQPPTWVDNPLKLTWELQLEYAQQMLSQVTKNVWQEQLQQHKYQLQNTALVFPLAALIKPLAFDDKLIKNRKSIDLISAARDTGKSAHAKRLILDAWIEAAVKQAPMPEYVWLQFGEEISYSSIFDVVTDVPKHVANDGDVTELKIQAHAKVSQYFNAYIKGKQVVSNWQEIVDQLEFKYADKGGIQARIAQLSVALQDARARNRHLQVLNSIWQRQIELLPKITRVLDFISACERARLQRLYVFFKQNFNADDVQDFTQQQFEELFSVKLRRGQNNERFIADALHQTENDIRQENLIRNKCMQWVATVNSECTELSAIADLLYNKIWDQLVIAAIQYWQLFDAVVKPVENIDLLIVENADYVAPMVASQLLVNTKRAVLMGGPDPICNPRFSVVVDYELTKLFKLASCDADFEDLQYDGVLGSTGNMWNLVAHGAEADQIFSVAEKPILSYEIFDITTSSEDCAGSKINRAEATAIVNFVQKNKHLLDKIAVFASFGGQVAHIKHELNKIGFNKIPVLPVQQPGFVKYDICLFSSVYTLLDPGPYCFDRGVEILANLTANAQKQLLVFGDARIFKPSLHSAAGKFAKLLFKNKEKQKEVNCV